MSVHEPVMGAQVADALELKDGGWFADCTYGRGGYVREWLRRAKVRVYAIDRDPDAIRNAEQLSAETGGAVTPVPGTAVMAMRHRSLHVAAAVHVTCAHHRHGPGSGRVQLCHCLRQ